MLHPPRTTPPSKPSISPPGEVGLFSEAERGRAAARPFVRKTWVPRKTLARRRGDDWTRLLQRAAELVQRRERAGQRTNLRKLHYLLFEDGQAAYENLLTEYQQLASKTAAARREGWFPRLSDLTRSIDRPRAWGSAAEAQDWLRTHFRIDRTEGQPYALYLVVEKSALVEDVWDWFSDLGVPIMALRGYDSQGHIDEILDDVTAQVTEELRGELRPAIALYAGDFDASGEDIYRDFKSRATCFQDVVRVALTSDQVRDLNLVKKPGKPRDPRADRFRQRHGGLFQTELDALTLLGDGEELRRLYQAAIDRYWDVDAYQAALDREDSERELLP